MTEHTKKFVAARVDCLERNHGKDSKFVEAFKVAAAAIGNLDDPLKEKIAEFLLEYAFFDHQEMYTNGALVVPFYRVLDALMQNGNPYGEEES